MLLYEKSWKMKYFFLILGANSIKKLICRSNSGAEKFLLSVYNFYDSFCDYKMRQFLFNIAQARLL